MADRYVSDVHVHVHRTCNASSRIIVVHDAESVFRENVDTANRKLYPRDSDSASAGEPISDPKQRAGPKLASRSSFDRHYRSVTPRHSTVRSHDTVFH